MKEIAEELGGLSRLSPFQRGLVKAAAELIVRQPVGHAEAIQQAKTLNRLYGTLRTRRAASVRRIGG
jgi:hypothetical protein